MIIKWVYSVFFFLGWLVGRFLGGVSDAEVEARRACGASWVDELARSKRGDLTYPSRLFCELSLSAWKVGLGLDMVLVQC